MRRTSCRDKFQVMRHRRVIDESVCDHLVCFLIANKDAEDDSRGRQVQLQSYAITVTLDARPREAADGKGAMV